jgi:hypothetical protein
MEHRKKHLIATLCAIHIFLDELMIFALLSNLKAIQKDCACHPFLKLMVIEM